MEHSSTSPHPAPADIAAGIGLASRREICGLLGLLKTAATVEILKDIAKSAKDKFRATSPPDASQVARISEGLLEGPRSTDALRHQLWFELSRALGVPYQFPLSVRRIESDAAAMGIRAAEILKPSVLATRRGSAHTESGWAEKAAKKTKDAFSNLQSSQANDVSFSDVVAAEIKLLLDGLAEANSAGTLGPEVAAAIRKGQVAMAGAPPPLGAVASRSRRPLGLQVLHLTLSRRSCPPSFRSLAARRWSPFLL